MQSVYERAFISVHFAIMIFGMILNGFIVLMNGKTWIRNKCLPTGDKIITSLCLSRWMLHCLVMVHQTFQYFLQRISLGFASVIFFFGRFLLNYISIWLASLLCVYYCVKITNYKHAVFLYVKANMSRLVPWCLGLCVLLSLALTWLQQALITNDFQNTTQAAMEGQHFYFIGSSPPLLILSIAFFLTVPSLWRHIRNMSGAGTSLRNPDMKTHYNAIKSMVAFFLLHMLHIVASNIYVYGLRQSEYKPLLYIVSSLYLCLHSGVIIYYNRKLKEKFVSPMTRILNIFRGKQSLTPGLWVALVRRLHA